MAHIALLFHSILATMGNSCGHMATHEDIADKTSSPVTIHDEGGYLSFLVLTLGAHHCRRSNLRDYVTMGLQDAQYSPNMTTLCKATLREVDYIMKVNPHIGAYNVGDIIDAGHEIASVAKRCESCMIDVLSEHTSLRDWFMRYDPDTYVGNHESKLIDLAELTITPDGLHTEFGFALCCSNVRRTLF